MTTADTPPILGLGTDIIEIERIRKSIDTHGYRLLSRLFTTKEQDYCLKHKDPVPHFAGRFSAKEAIVKALGTGFGEHVTWRDFEILNDKSGKPTVHLSPALKKKLKKSTLIVTISHCESYATATALWLTVKKRKTG